jgi:hypothetical protein
MMRTTTDWSINELSEKSESKQYVSQKYNARSLDVPIDTSRTRKSRVMASSIDNDSLSLRRGGTDPNVGEMRAVSLTQRNRLVIIKDSTIGHGSSCYWDVLG